MRRLLLITSLIPLLLVSGCRTEKEARLHTEYLKVYELDSVYVDCTDTLYIVERGDTVRITETKTVKELRYKVFRDTARITDTVTVEKTVTAAAADTSKKRNGWKFFAGGFLTAILLIFAARILIKIYLKK